MVVQSKELLKIFSGGKIMGFKVSGRFEFEIDCDRVESAKVLIRNVHRTQMGFMAIKIFIKKTMRSKSLKNFKR